MYIKHNKKFEQSTFFASESNIEEVDFQNAYHSKR